VMAYTYRPTSKDEHLRCPDTKPASEEEPVISYFPRFTFMHHHLAANDLLNKRPVYSSR
jgi:hypothetical protein